jgi:glycosyltransferase involved in cell wall biosynthesis
MSTLPPNFSLLHTEWSSGWGGQEIRILAECKAFRERGAHVFIATQPNGQLFAKANEAGFEVIPIKMHKGLNIGAVVQFMGIIKSRHINVVHAHSSVDHRLAGIAARLSGCPIVRSRHLSTPIKRSPFSKALYTRLADRVITSGQFIRDAMINHNGMPPEHIVSIPAGIDVAQFSLARALPDMRAELGIAPSAFVVGIVGVLRSWKGHADLIHAVRLLSSEIPDLRLLIVGEGVQRDALETLIRETGMTHSVIMVGHQKDPAPYMKAMDVAVLPSYASEATSQVLPQAMAMQRPVIATNIGGLPEVVLHEKTGLLVPPRDSAALSAAILRLQRDPTLRQYLANEGYRHTQGNFTFEGMIDKTQSVYQALLTPSTREQK